LGFSAPPAAAQSLLERAVKVRHDPAGGVHAAVEEHRAEQRLEGILERGGAIAAAGRLFARSEAQGAVQADLPGQPGEEGAVGEHGAVPAEGALPFGRVLEVQRLREHELQHGVAEELEPLVALREVRLVLQSRRVGERPRQQRPVAEDVTEARFEGGGGGGVHELALA
jgi:hypothetical protein